MNSPLVARLTSDMAACANAERLAELQTELACYWARVGNFEEAEKLKREVRAVFGDGRCARVSILLLCLDSLLLYFKDLNPLARDRMERANLLSRLFKHQELTALTSAWMAHFDFNQNRFQKMAEALRACFEVLAEDDSATECRVSLVLGDAFCLIGDASSSRGWYERARKSANKIGDHAAIGALIYNQAALVVTSLRLKSLSVPLEDSELLSVRSIVNSAINYQAAAQLSSLEHLLLTAEIGVAILQTNWLVAEPKIRHLLSLDDVPPRSGQRLLLEADLAAALANSGRREQAMSWMNSLDPTSYSAHPDDRLLAAAQLSAASGVCGDQAGHSKWSALAKDARREYDQMVEGLRPHLTVYIL